jgi:hypothetical protein
VQPASRQEAAVKSSAARRCDFCDRALPTPSVDVLTPPPRCRSPSLSRGSVCQ